MNVPIRISIVLTLWAVVIVGLAIFFNRMRLRGVAFERLRRDAAPVEFKQQAELTPGWLRQRMMLAGFDSASSGTILVCLTLLTLAIGIACAVAFRVSRLQDLLLEGVEAIPGGLSGMLVPVVLVSPWLITIMVTMLPVLYVRDQRRKRISQVNRDLPLALDLWATLCEGGLGFDAALDRWQRTQPKSRVLASACRGFQRDLLGGMRRSKAYRRLAHRLEVPGLTRFTSAMIQSEQMGSSVSNTLRLQADDVRAARREKSLAFAQSLATKRVIPLVICFLPGLFVWPLGPFFTQLLRIVDGLTGGG